MAYPSIQAPSYPLGEEVSFPQIRTEFESGSVQSRPRWTKSRRIFTLSWTAMSDSDYSSLESAFLADQGTTFAWVHPVTSVSYTVRYQGDSLKSEVTSPGKRKVQVVLEEA